MRQLVKRAQQAGVMRTDVTPQDVTLLVLGVARTSRSPGAQHRNSGDVTWRGIGRFAQRRARPGAGHPDPARRAG